MAQRQICSCSCIMGAAGSTRIIFPCAGPANTGQLPNLAVIRLTEESYGSTAWVAHRFGKTCDKEVSGALHVRQLHHSILKEALAAAGLEKFSEEMDQILEQFPEKQAGTV